MNELHRKLFFQHLLTTAVILLAAEAALYGLIRRSAYARMETALRNHIGRISSLAQVGPDVATLDDRRADEPAFDEARLSWQVLTADDRVLSSSRDLVGGRLLPAVGGELPRDRLVVSEADVLYLGRMLVGRVRVEKARLDRAGRPAALPAAMLFDIRAAIRTEDVEQGARQLLLFLLVGFPVVLTVAGLAAHQLIGRAVRPVALALQRDRRFAGAASHQLRTPLTAMRGEIDVALRRDRSADEYADTLRRLAPTVAHMTKVIESLLTLARVEAGHLLIGSADLTTAELAAALREVIAPLPDRARVAVQDELAGTGRVAGDPVQLAQAVRNLVENALCHGGTGTVTLALRHLPGELEIQITDEGAGFPATVLAAPGARRGETTDAPARFGLALARAVVAAHGGTLTIANRDQGGGLARIGLPLLR